MKKLVTVLCILAIGSMAIADFTEDFEAMVTLDLIVSPWGGGSTAAQTGELRAGVGTNTSNVFSGGYNKWLWLDVPEASQYAAGSVEFDFTMECWYAGAAPVGYPGIHFYATDDDHTDGSIANIRIHQDPGVGGDGFDLQDVTNDQYLLTDFVDSTGTGWFTLRLDFDTGTSTYDLYLDDDLKASDVAFLGSNEVELNRVAWNNDWGYYPHIDNVSVIPVPATMALLALGGLLIRRKK